MWRGARSRQALFRPRATRAPGSGVVTPGGACLRSECAQRGRPVAPWKRSKTHRTGGNSAACQTRPGTDPPQDSLTPPGRRPPGPGAASGTETRGTRPHRIGEGPQRRGAVTGAAQRTTAHPGHGGGGIHLRQSRPGPGPAAALHRLHLPRGGRSQDPARHPHHADRTRRPVDHRRPTGRPGRLPAEPAAQGARAVRPQPRIPPAQPVRELGLARHPSPHHRTRDHRAGGTGTRRGVRAGVHRWHPRRHQRPSAQAPARRRRGRRRRTRFAGRRRQRRTPAASGHRSRPPVRLPERAARLRPCRARRRHRGDRRLPDPRRGRGTCTRGIQRLRRTRAADRPGERPHGRPARGLPGRRRRWQIPRHPLLRRLGDRAGRRQEITAAVEQLRREGLFFDRKHQEH